MTKVYGILFFVMMVCVGCEWHLKPASPDDTDVVMTIDRFDRIESLFLTTGDFSAMQQMNTTYPMQTRLLIEDMLCVGKVDDPDINMKFLRFFQDSTLQHLLVDVQEQYADVDDLNEELSAAFGRLKEDMPELVLPKVYAQIGSFDESILVGHGTLGISLDKYLGSDYPFYQAHYSENQRQLMVRQMIVPDCLAFYILSLYPMPGHDSADVAVRDRHMGKIQWVVNRVTHREVFRNSQVDAVGRYMNAHRTTPLGELLRDSTAAAY